MDGSQNSYNHSEPDTAGESRHFLSNARMHIMFPQNKSRPVLCSSWAVIVCLVQLHLKGQRPRAMGRIKDCVQSSTPWSSCQRGFTPSLPLPLILFSYVSHKKNALSSFLSYTKALSDSSCLVHSRPPQCPLISLQPMASACRQENSYYFFMPGLEGVKVESYPTAPSLFCVLI